MLVEFQAGYVPSLRFVSIEREFSGLLHGRRLDMVTPTFLNSRIRDQVLDSAEPLHLGVDEDIVWQVVTEGLPTLVAAIEPIVAPGLGR